MATHHDLGAPSGVPLSALLATIPSLPRPVLSRLVQHAIDQMDEMDGDPDLEPEEPVEDQGDEGVTTWAIIDGKRRIVRVTDL